MPDQIKKAHQPRPHIPATLSKEDAETFKKLDWCGVCFVGPLDATAKGLGDSEGIAPIMPVISTEWADKLSASFDKTSPTCAQAMLFRIWLESKVDAKRLLVELPAFFSTRAEKMRGAWYGLDVGTDLLELQIKMLEFATTRGLQAFDDEDALRLLREPTERAAA